MSQAKRRISFKIPGKTFLLGEYLAVFGGPSLVLATLPAFDVSFAPGEGRHPFHRQSPAGRYMGLHQDFFSGWDIDFQDPFEGQGGFGASTAQFIAVYLMHSFFDQIESGQGVDLQDLGSVVMPAWHAYRDLFDTDDMKPSGADLIAQMRGGLSFFRGRDENFAALAWPFKDLDVLLLKTPYKINTHEHLADLQVEEWPLARLESAVEKARAALLSENKSEFLQAVGEFSIPLKELGLVHADVQKIAEGVMKNPAVFAARGCGAMGADVLAVFVDRNLATGDLPFKQMTALGDHPVHGVCVITSVGAN